MRLSFGTRLLILILAAFLAACGHKSSSTTTTSTPTSITVSPSSLSLTHGDVVSIGNVAVLDQTNTKIGTTPTFTYTSADPASVTVTPAGLICAGVFDANDIVCKATDSNGNPLPDKTVNITVSALGLSTAVPVFVHGHVDNVTVLGPANPPVCISQNQTEQFTAKAFSNGKDITAAVGAFDWSAGSSIARVDSNGVVTALQPGATTIVASVANTTGTPALVVGCPPKTISLHIANATDTSFNVAAATAQTLAADVTDILGQPITGASLTFSSYVPTAASVSGTSVSTPGAGVSTIVASCTPPACNPAGPNVNLNNTGSGLAVYSNPVIGAVTGTTATTIYVTGKDNPDGSANKTLVPIDSAANTAGTAITLAGSPNSMAFNRAGTTAYIGSDAGLLIFDPGTNAVTATASGITGRVLAVSNDGVKIIVADTSKFFVFDSGGTVQEFDLAGVTSADFDSDNSKAYLTSGSNVYEYSPSTASVKTLTFAADGVAFAPQASVVYFGGSSISALAVCNDSAIPASAASGAANILAPAPDGTHLVGVGSAGWVDLAYSVSNTNGCPATASNSAVRSAAFPAFVGTPTQIAVASNDSNAFLTGYSGGAIATSVPFYHLADGATGSVALAGAGGPLFSGGLTQDAHSLYVGIGQNGSAAPQVHRIDLTGMSDANQINVTFNPRIVVVRPK